MSKGKERVFGVFFMVTEDGFKKVVANPQTAKEAQVKLLKEINDRERINIPKEIKKEFMKKIQKFLDEA